MKHFTIREFLQSSTAGALGLNNIPGDKEVEALEALVDNILDPAREAFDAPITVSSGYRSPALNKAVGGASTSQHMKGEAADLKCSDNAKLFAILLDKGGFDQLIWEYGNAKQPDWVHVSYRADGKNRGQALKTQGKKYIPYTKK